MGEEFQEVGTASNAMLIKSKVAVGFNDLEVIGDLHIRVVSRSKMETGLPVLNKKWGMVIMGRR